MLKNPRLSLEAVSSKHPSGTVTHPHTTYCGPHINSKRIISITHDYEPLHRLRAITAITLHYVTITHDYTRLQAITSHYEPLRAITSAGGRGRPRPAAQRLATLHAGPRNDYSSSLESSSLPKSRAGPADLALAALSTASSFGTNLVAFATQSLAAGKRATLGCYRTEEYHSTLV